MENIETFKELNYTNETIVGIAPLNVVKLSIIQDRDNFILAYEWYSKQVEDGGDPSLASMLSRLKTWFLKMQAYLKRKFKPEEYILIEDTIMHKHSITIDELMKMYCMLNEEMDSMGLTKIDTKEKIDRSRVEIANRSHGL